MDLNDPSIGYMILEGLFLPVLVKIYHAIGRDSAFSENKPPGRGMRSDEYNRDGKRTYWK